MVARATMMVKKLKRIVTHGEKICEKEKFNFDFREGGGKFFKEKLDENQGTEISFKKIIKNYCFEFCFKIKKNIFLKIIFHPLLRSLKLTKAILNTTYFFFKIISSKLFLILKTVCAKVENGNVPLKNVLALVAYGEIITLRHLMGVNLTSKVSVVTYCQRAWKPMAKDILLRSKMSYAAPMASHAQKLSLLIYLVMSRNQLHSHLIPL